MIIKGYILTYLYILLLLVIAKLLYIRHDGTLTRKFIHIGVSFCYVIFYKYFGTSIHLLLASFSFIILNVLSYKYDIVKEMEEKKSLGTVYYAISIFVMALITYFKHDFYISFGVGLFVLAFGDGFACLFGQKIKSPKIYKDKTLVGTLTVFIMSIIVMVVFNHIFGISYGIIKIIVISIIASLLELFGVKGIDDLYLPIGVSILYYLLGVI